MEVIPPAKTHEKGKEGGKGKFHLLGLGARHLRQKKERRSLEREEGLYHTFLLSLVRR